MKLKRLRKPRQLVAVTWDHHELLAVVAAPIRGGLELLTSLAIPNDRGTSLTAVGRELAAALTQHQVGAYQLLISLPRTQVEMVSLELPPATAAELPEMVRNEMTRRFGDLPDDVVIDYYDIGVSTPVLMGEAARATSSERIRVEAAAMRPDTQAIVRSLCDALGTPPERIVIRSLAIASLFRRQVRHLPDKSLLLNLMQSNADLSVLERDRITFTRSIHLSPREDGSPDPSHLSDEIRLTLFVAPEATAAAPTDDPPEIQHIYMFADLDRQSAFVNELAEDVQLPVTLLDPLAGVEVRGGDRPERTHRLAALIGMVWDHLDRRVSIDFAHPKQAPVPQRVNRKIVFYATAASLALLIGGAMLRRDVHEVQQVVDELAAEVDAQKALLKKIRAKTSVLDGVERWEAAQIHWLNELRDLSARFPAADQAAVQRMTMAPSAGSRGLISMSVRVHDPALIANLENNLRDAKHQVSSQRISQSGGEDDPVCQFETSVIVTPLKAAPPAKVATAPSAREQ